MEARAIVADRIVYSTAERIAYRGVHARAKAFGFSIVKASNGLMTVYVSAGVPERVRRIIPGVSVQFHACTQCGYADASLIAEHPHACDCCKQDAAALHALSLQAEWGIDLGWKCTAPVPFMGDARRERLWACRTRANMLSVSDAKRFGVRRKR